MQRYLFIGIGGSGGKTLAYLWRSLDRRLKAQGWTGPFPKVWQFLHIDPRERSDAWGRDIPPLPVGAVRYLALAESPRSYAAYDRDLVASESLQGGMVGWRPEPPADIEAPFLGAGQLRAVGRSLALASLDKIRVAVSEAATSMFDNESEAERLRLRDAFGFPAQDPAYPAHPVVISSLAGGSGSGAFLDVIQAIRSIRSDSAWQEDILTILYTSELFEHLTEGQRGGIHANALAAVSELLAAHEGALDPRATALVRRGGVQTLGQGDRRSGPTTALIGMTSGGVKLGSESEVYRTIGNALAGSLTNSTVQNELSSFTVNLRGDAFRPESPLSRFAVGGNAAYKNAVASFGYSSVGLGRSLFAQYAAERLAKQGLERLLRGHRKLQVPGSTPSEDRLITEAADQRETPFFEASGLWEAGPTHFEISNALRQIPTVKGMLDAAKERVLARLRQSTASISPGDVLGAITAQFDAETPTVVSEATLHREDQARKWVIAAPERLVDAVVTEVGIFGIPTALELLKRLDTQLGDAVAELEAVRVKFEGEERGFLAGVAGVFGNLKDKITYRHGKVEEAAQQRRDALQRRVEGDVMAMAHRLIVDARAHLLPQLRLALDVASSNLANLENTNGTDRTKFDRWSVGPLPLHLKPAPNEFLLEPAMGYPDAFEATLAQVFDAQSRNAEETAISESLSGAWPKMTDPGTVRVQSLVKSERAWMPEDASARAGGAASSFASFRISLDADTLLERAESWVRGRAGFGSYVAETLADYLGAGTVEASRRAQEFEAQFRSALRASRPLINYDSEIGSMVHTRTELGTIETFSPIPLAQGTPLYDQIRQALLDHGMRDDAIPALFDANSRATDCEIVSFMDSSKHPVVFSSLFDPIEKDWQSRVTAGPGERAKFWSLRRARTLPEFVPLSIDLQQALIRGWYTAANLGQLRDIALADRGVSVWTNEGWATFPFPYLTGVERSRPNVLSAILESFPLVFLDLSGGRTGSQRAYARLLQLATGADTDDPKQCTALNAELLAWITKGELTAGFGEAAPAPDEAAAGTAEMSAADRGALLVASFEGPIHRYRELAPPRLNTLENRLEVDRQWEIASLVPAALDPVLTLLRSEVVPPTQGVGDL